MEKGNVLVKAKGWGGGGEWSKQIGGEGGHLQYVNKK